MRDPVKNLLADLRKALGVGDDVPAGELVGLVKRQGVMLETAVKTLMEPTGNCPPVHYKYCPQMDIHCQEPDCPACWRAYLEGEAG